VIAGGAIASWAGGYVGGMEPISFLPAPGAPTDSEEQDLAEIDAAIELIRQGIAARVRLVGLRAPETVAGAGLARAQANDVWFSVDRGAGGAIALTIGPRR
jgi:hypothetical protein